MSAVFFRSTMVLLLCAWPLHQGNAYPGTIDVRVASGSEAMQGKARDLEQTLMAAMYSLGAKVGRRSSKPDDEEGGKVRKTLSEVLRRIHQRLSPADIRDLRIVTESVEREFRDRPGSVGIELWSDLLQAQATLLAMSGHDEQAKERFSFLFNLRAESGSSVVGNSPGTVRALAERALTAWKSAPQAELLFKDLSEGARVFVDGKPVSVENQRVSGLRVGLHLVQVMNRDAPPFGAVVRLHNKGLATIVVVNRRGDAAASREETEKAILGALLKKDEKLPETAGLPALFGVDGVLFVALRGDGKRGVAVRGVLVHEEHSPRTLMLTLKPGMSVRESLTGELKKLLQAPAP